MTGPRVARVLVLDPDQATALASMLAQWEEGWKDRDDAEQIEAVLAKLDSDPLDGWQPDRWWQVVNPEIEDWRQALWCETSDEAEAREHFKRGLAKGMPLVLQRFWRMELRQVLSEEDNDVAEAAWRAR